MEILTGILSTRQRVRRNSSNAGIRIQPSSVLSRQKKRAATSSPRCRPGSQSFGTVRRAKCPPTSTARFGRAHSALVW